VTSVKLAQGTVAIGREAFAGCAQLEKVYIPATVSYLGSLIFDGCPEGLTLYGAAGSPAEAYADGLGIRFLPVE